MAELTQRFRRQVAPYNVMASLYSVGGTSYCPEIQTYRAGSVDIDRTVAPTLLQAQVSANSNDNSGSIASVTDAAVENIEWYVQGDDDAAPIKLGVPNDKWQPTDYTIGEGADKGKLYIHKNIGIASRVYVWMQCKVLDNRRSSQIDIRVVTNKVMLYSIEDGAEIYKMSIDRPNGEVYEPEVDRLLLHEYLTSIGKPSTFTDDGKAYLRKLNVNLVKGGVQLTAGTDYDIEIQEIVAGVATVVTPQSCDSISAVNGSEITFDLRFAERANFRILCKVDGDMVGQKYYGWQHSPVVADVPEGIIGAVTYGDKNVTETFRARLQYDGKPLVAPHLAYNLDWYYRKYTSGGVAQDTHVGSGAQAQFKVASMVKNNIGEAVLKMEKRGVFKHLTDGADLLTDGNGNVYCEN